jgi:hypothetical protein
LRGRDDLDALVAELDELLGNACGQRLIGTGDDEFAVKNVAEEKLGSDLFFTDALLELQMRISSSVE